MKSRKFRIEALEIRYALTADIHELVSCEELVVSEESPPRFAELMYDADDDGEEQPDSEEAEATGDSECEPSVIDDLLDEVSDEEQLDYPAKTDYDNIWYMTGVVPDPVYVQRTLEIADNADSPEVDVDLAVLMLETSAPAQDGELDDETEAIDDVVDKPAIPAEVTEEARPELNDNPSATDEPIDDPVIYTMSPGDSSGSESTPVIGRFRFSALRRTIRPVAVGGNTGPISPTTNPRLNGTLIAHRIAPRVEQIEPESPPATTESTPSIAPSNNLFTRHSRARHRRS